MSELLAGSKNLYHLKGDIGPCQSLCKDIEDKIVKLKMTWQGNAV